MLGSWVEYHEKIELQIRLKTFLKENKKAKKAQYQITDWGYSMDLKAKGFLLNESPVGEYKRIGSLSFLWDVQPLKTHKQAKSGF